MTRSLEMPEHAAEGHFVERLDWNGNLVIGDWISIAAISIKLD